MRGARHSRMRLPRALIGSAMLLVPSAPAAAQQAEEPRPSEPRKPARDANEIVVVGRRGSAVTTVAPITVLDAEMITGTGATNIGELLRTIRGATVAADGSEPIFLLNAQRVSGYEEIGSLPPEAIEKVEVLPEQAALKFGYPPTRRVVNFITKQNFRQLEVKASAGSTTRWGSDTEKANFGLTRLKGGSRLTINLEARRTDSLFVSDRNIVPDPEIPFDTVGNIVGLGGGEINPALSAAAGVPVTIAPVPLNVADRTSLTGFAAGANRPRLFDLGPYRTLVPDNHAIKGEAVFASRIGETLSGSISLSAERSRDRSLGGPASVYLTVPETNPFSPFDRPVRLARYLTEVPELRQDQTTTTLHGGMLLRGAIAGWRWDLTGTFDQKQIDGRSEQGIDVTAANAAIAAGANPFAPLDPALLKDRLVDVARQRTRTLGAKAVVTGTPFSMPAGQVNLTATVEAERASAASSTRGANPFQFDLGRTRLEGGIAIDVPLTSRREDVLAWIGDLSLNGSARVRSVGGFGTLNDHSFGIAWSPIEGIQLLGTLKHSAAAPDLAAQSTPVVRVPNVPIFDFVTGRTQLVELIQGGNPDLLAEARDVRSIALNIKPFAKRELRISATYEATTIRNQTGTVYAITPQTAALLPDLFTRDANGQLLSVAYRPINYFEERQRALNVTVNFWGQLGKTPPPPDPANPKPPKQRPNVWGGFGPTIKFSDTLQLRPGTPELDLLAGDTVNGGGAPRAYGYFYAGANYLGNGFNFDGWIGGANRVRSDDPVSDLRFSSIVKMNLGVFVSVHHFLPKQGWTKRMQFRVDISNLTDGRTRVRDGNGDVPNRLQADYLDPVGRTVTFSLRKLF